MDELAAFLTFGMAAALVVALVFVLALFSGRRQRREAGGSWGRLCSVSLGVAGLASLPLVVGGAQLALRTWGGPIPPEALGETLAGGALASVLCGLWPLLFLGPPVRLVGPEPLPELEDEGVLGRVDELSRAMGVSTPRVRVLRSVGGSLKALAWSGGLGSPSLVLADGILHRLAPQERDGIVAHELAHIATGSLWSLAALGPLAGAAGVLVLPHVGPAGAVTFALASFVFLRRVVGRRIEVACDLRGARAAGFATLVDALDKIHAAHPIPNDTLLGAVTYALATHPPQAIRRDALRRAAPESEASAIAADPAGARRAYRAARLAAVAWVACAALALWLGEHGWPLLLGLTLAPTVLVTLAVRRRTQLAKRRLAGRQRVPGARLQLAGLGCLLLGLWTLAEMSTPPEPWTMPLAAAGLLLGLALLAASSRPMRASNRLRQAVGQAFARRDYAQALAQVRLASPKVLQRDPALRHDVALLRALNGEAEVGAAMLGELSPELPLAGLSLAFLSLHAAPERALAAAERVAERLPADPLPHTLRARALLRLGRVEEAKEASERARFLDAGDGGVTAVAALVALADGALEAARALVEESLAREPGAGLPLLAQARLLEATDGPEAALPAVEAALAAAEANPFAFLEGEVKELRDRLAGRIGADQEAV